MAKTFTHTDLAAHNTKDNLYLAIHGKVYDCSGFIDEHPGGEEVLLDEGGRDATESFEDVGHSDEARDIMSKLYVGEYKSDGTEKKSKPAHSSTPKPIPAAEPAESNRLQYVLALGVVAGCVIWKVLS
ncbi:cytochrome b5-like heme/steroid binding domain-containing protein [Mortierella sp. GBAus27b]|nr:cytochrome b5-like heme/steroid binding domain-containing protein [Mortierella sp. GBAus27b]